MHLWMDREPLIYSTSYFYLFLHYLDQIHHQTAYHLKTIDKVIFVKLHIVYVPLLFVLHMVSVVSSQVSQNGYVQMIQAISTLINYYIPILCSCTGFMGN